MFMLRRLSVDPVIAVVTYRGPSDRLDEAAQRLLLERGEPAVPPAGRAGPGGGRVAGRRAAGRSAGRGGGPVAVPARPAGTRCTCERCSARAPASIRDAPGRLAVPRSLAAAVGDHLRVLPTETRVILEMLAVLNLRMPLAQLGQAAQVGSPSAAIEPAVAAGLVEWWPEEPTCPVAIRHLLVRDAIYAGITVTRRRLLHARAAELVSEAASWEHRVAALDQPDEDLAAELEQLAAAEAAAGPPRAGRHPPAVGLGHLPGPGRPGTAAADRRAAPDAGRGVPGRWPCARRSRRPAPPRCAAACWAPWRSPPASSPRRNSGSARRWRRRGTTRAASRWPP